MTNHLTAIDYYWECWGKNDPTKNISCKISGQDTQADNAFAAKKFIRS